MIDHQRALQPLEYRFPFREAAAIKLQLHMPPERRHARRHGLENLPRQRRSGQHEKANAAGAEPGQLVELGVGRGLIDNDDTACIRPKGGDGLERAAIVLTVGRRLNHDGALNAETRAHLAVGRNGRIRRHELRGRRFWIFAIVDMHMGVAGACGRLELRRDAAFDERHGADLGADETGAVRIRETADGLRQQMLREP